MRTWFKVKLSSLSADTTGQLNVLGHDRHTLGVNSAQVGIFKQTHKVGFGSLLKGQHSSGLESQVSLEILSNFTNQTLERCLADQQISTLLVLADLTKSHGTRTITMGLLHTSGGGCGLSCSLSKENS
jgi:hypothetical protein